MPVNDCTRCEVSDGFSEHDLHHKLLVINILRQSPLGTTGSVAFAALVKWYRYGRCRPGRNTALTTGSVSSERSRVCLRRRRFLRETPAFMGGASTNPRVSVTARNPRLSKKTAGILSRPVSTVGSAD